MKFNQLIKKLKQCFLLSDYERRSNLSNIMFDDDLEYTEMVPEDVKKGHFAVTAINGGEEKRFIVELWYLSNPEFTMLLEQAREEYGFWQKGVLCVPCQPAELQNILDGRTKKGECSES
ncbi:hypothetical protein ACFE04_020086 [Oxalis oulophora]